MSRLLTVLGYCVDDAINAEALLDWIYKLNGKIAYGHCLLCPADDVHEELRIKTKIAAAIAFESVEVATIKPHAGATKAEQINNLFRQASIHAAQMYRLPFLWLEPDAIPVKPGWLEILEDAYDSQVKRFMGPHLSTKKDPDQLWMGRVAVYAHDAAKDLDGHCKAPQPFERTSATAIIPRSSKSRLIQYGSFDGDLSKIRPDAVLFHGNKDGTLIEALRATDIADKMRVPVVTRGTRQTRQPRTAKTAEEVNGN